MVSVPDPFVRANVMAPAVAATVPLGLNCSVVAALTVMSPLVDHGIALPRLEKPAAQAGGVPVRGSDDTW